MRQPHRYLFVASFLLVAPIAAFAGVAQKCPTVSIGPSTAEITAGKSLILVARLTGLSNTAQPEFHWEVSVGTIVSGQGAPRLTVDIAGLEGQIVTSRVSIGGIATCSVEAFHSFPIRPAPPIGEPFDYGYGRINFEDEKARLDNFAIQLQNEPGAQGYIYGYAGRDPRKGEVAKRLRRAKDYLVRIRQMKPGRIVTIDGGYREDFTMILIIVPSGAVAPLAMPTLSPSEVEGSKPRPKSARKISNKSRNK